MSAASTDTMTTITNTISDVIISSGRKLQQLGRRNDDDGMTTSFQVVEPDDEETLLVDRQRAINKTVRQFEDRLAERAAHLLGYPANQNCTHFAALSSLLTFSINNIGDPFNESNFGLHSKKFEVQVLDWFARLWGIEDDGNQEYWGFITNGGSESNYQAILLGRELFPDGILYASVESHYSIFKATRMYRMDSKIISSLYTGEIDYDELRETLLLNKDKPAIINANIGTTFKGAMDNLDLIIKILEECGFSRDRYYIHCDAAQYGLLCPFLEQPPFSFKKSIASVSVSAHKLLGSPMPCGVLITWRKHISALWEENVEYIASFDTTISGSRNGHSPIFVWYSLNMKGRKGIKKDIRKCLENARYLRDGLRNGGISTMLNDNSIIVVFERPRDQGFIDHWQLAYLGNLAHVVVMPHVSTEMLDVFIADFVKNRQTWYKCCDDVVVEQPPCIADEIGASNCACSVHGRQEEAKVMNICI